MEVHLVCTEDMTNALNRLHGVFLNSERNKTRHEAVRASSSVEEGKARAQVPQHLVEWIEKELSPESVALHALICGGRGIFDAQM